MSRPTEDELIAKLLAPLAGPAGLGLRDDAALLSVPVGHELVLTKDMLIGGVHFFPDDPPGAIAQKALRVNLSDLASKAAEPMGYLLGLALPPDWTETWLEAFAQGLAEDGRNFGFSLIGGDTVKTTGPLSISVTALGSVPAAKMISRPGVKNGDVIYVSGTVGDSALGLKLRLNLSGDEAWSQKLSLKSRYYLQERYLLPQPRLEFRAILRDYARTAMDISDGLLGDLGKMLRLTGITMNLQTKDVPLSDAARECLELNPYLIETVLTGGDDYEILCSIPPEKAEAFEADIERRGMYMNRIGRAIDGSSSIKVMDESGNLLVFPAHSFQHF